MRRYLAPGDGPNFWLPDLGETDYEFISRCCKNIEIEVTCDPGHSWEGSMKGAKQDPKVKAACEYRNTYSCKSGFENPKFRYQNGGAFY